MNGLLELSHGASAREFAEAVLETLQTVDAELARLEGIRLMLVDAFGQAMAAMDDEDRPGAPRSIRAGNAASWCTGPPAPSWRSPCG